MLLSLCVCVCVFKSGHKWTAESRRRLHLCPSCVSRGVQLTARVQVKGPCAWLCTYIAASFNGCHISSFRSCQGRTNTARPNVACVTAARILGGLVHLDSALSTCADTLFNIECKLESAHVCVCVLLCCGLACRSGCIPSAVIP